MRVADIMTAQVVTIPADATVGEALALAALAGLALGAMPR